MCTSRKTSLHYRRHCKNTEHLLDHLNLRPDHPTLLTCRPSSHAHAWNDGGKRPPAITLYRGSCRNSKCLHSNTSQNANCAITLYRGSYKSVYTATPHKMQISHTNSLMNMGVKAQNPVPPGHTFTYCFQYNNTETGAHPLPTTVISSLDHKEWPA